MTVQRRDFEDDVGEMASGTTAHCSQSGAQLRVVTDLRPTAIPPGAGRRESWHREPVPPARYMRTCTESSNPSRSAIQSGSQRNLAIFLQESLENAAISRLRSSNQTGESVLLYSAGEIWGTFLRRAETQSGFDKPAWRMECDHKLVIWRERLDFWPGTEGRCPFASSATLSTDARLTADQPDSLSYAPKT